MGDFKKISVCLDAEFVLGGGQEEAACVDLDGEWSEQSKIFRHPDYDDKNVVFVSAEVGEGGDHMNITLKNISDSVIKIPGDKIVAFLSENPDEPDPSAEAKPSNGPNSTEEPANETNSTEDSSNEPISKEEPANKPDLLDEPAATEAESTKTAPEPETESSEQISETEGDKSTSETPLTESNPPLSEDETTVAEKELPEVEKESPEVEKESPEAEKESTEVEKESPGAVKESPATMETLTTKSDAPVTENQPPVAEKESPVEEKETSDAEEELPDAEKEPPVAEKESPVEEKETPDAEEELPAAEKELPVAEKESPVAEEKETSVAEAILDNATSDFTKEGEATGTESGDKESDSNPEKEQGDEDEASENGPDASVADKNDKQAETSDKSTDITESNEKESDEQMQSDEKEASDDAMEVEESSLPVNGTSELEPSPEKETDPFDKMVSGEDKKDTKEPTEKNESGKPMVMMFVNETEADEHHHEEADEHQQEADEHTHAETEGEDENKDKDKKDKDDAAKDKTNQEKDGPEEMEVDKDGDSKDAKDGKTKDTKEVELKTEEESTKPTLKLASFADMAEKKKPPPPHVKQQATRCCSSCGSGISSVKKAVVWATMQFCNINCLANYQATLANCSTCKKGVDATSSKYCVRFGSEIKQFCSKMCFEDYKKGLKVCSYCQKDISGGEGFMAPIGDKTQFKDFCEAACLERYEVRYNLKEEAKETDLCSVCKETKVIEQYIVRAAESIKLCAQSSCFSAFKFVNSVETDQCANCKKHYDTSMPRNSIFFEGKELGNCCKVCQNVSVVVQRKKVNCAHCNVEKYNFDMIEIFEEGEAGPASLYCSQQCRSMVKGAGPGLVISAISSLALPTKLPDLPTQPLPQLPPPPMQIQQQLVKEVSVVKETLVLPPETVVFKNKGLQTKPFMVTKGVSCKPHACTKGTQTDGPTIPTLLPIPLPIHVPVPCQMYNAPFPVPVPIPLPFPVPIFIPTTRNSIKGIMKQIKKIINKIPADPFEAELLALAGNIAEEDKDSSDSDDDNAGGAGDHDDGPVSNHTQLMPQPDLENEMTAEKIVPKPLPISTPEPGQQFPGYGGQFANQNNKRRASNRESDADDPDSEDDTWRPQSIWDQRPQRPARQAQRRQRGRTTQQNKRARVDNTREQQMAAVAAQQPKERQDVNHHLKFTYGVNAWKHWVVGKNAELEKQRAQGKYQKAFETDILKLRADELNFTLCLFVKEVKKPNGDSYAADSILYLVLGIQEYLFENNRIDNIFTDVYYDPFTSALHEVVKDFKLPVNELGYFVTRIEEEHLWESKQLGAHSPQVLLNTLVYFNTKYFQLKTVDQHLKLSFSHIMKHWKKANVVKSGEQQRTVLLRYYPPPAKGQKNDERKMYEQHENHENPLRCPVKLYEFYLSKCPEATKNRNDMFYLQPERSCVPDSPVWYTAHLLNRFNMEKMLARLLMVREVQEHMLADGS